MGYVTCGALFAQAAREARETPREAGRFGVAWTRILSGEICEIYESLMNQFPDEFPTIST